MEPLEAVQFGAGRSSQTTPIPPEPTVRENVQVASFMAEHGSSWVSFFRRRDSLDGVQSRTNNTFDTIGLDLKARVEAGSLPYGGKRRLGVAIGLATDPDPLFMDEPTADMFPTETQVMVSLIHDLPADWGVTIFLVEHDMDIVFDMSGRIFVLHQGRPIAQGTPEEIRKDPAIRETCLGGGEQ